MGETACRTGSRGTRLGMRVARLVAVAALAGAGLLGATPSAQAADGDFTGALRVPLRVSARRQCGSRWLATLSRMTS